MDLTETPASGSPSAVLPDLLHAVLPDGSEATAVEAAILNWLWRRHARIAATPQRLVVALRDAALPELGIATLQCMLAHLLREGFAPLRLRLFDPVANRLPDADIVIGSQHALLEAPPEPGPPQTQWLIDAPSVPTARRACERLAAAFAAGHVRVLPPAAHEAAAVLSSLPLRAAGELLDAHVTGTTTLAVVNTLAQMRAILRELQQLAPAQALVAVHPYYRSAHRSALAATLLQQPAGGRLLVATPAVAMQLRADHVLAAGNGETSGNGNEAPTLNVLWRRHDSDAPPQTAELCPAPPAALRKLRRERWLWMRDEQLWQPWPPATALPLGALVRLNAEDGGYDATLGWMPHARLAVVPALTAD